MLVRDCALSVRIAVSCDRTMANAAAAWAAPLTAAGRGGRGLGGLVAGDMKAFGAAGAKAGKTYFVGQMLDGLAMQTAYRLMGIPGYEDAPIVLVFWVSEMSKKSEVPMRFVARALGYDAKVTTQGVDAIDSVSLAALRSVGMTPTEYVTHARRLRAWQHRVRHNVAHNVARQKHTRGGRTGRV